MSPLECPRIDVCDRQGTVHAGVKVLD